MKTKGIIEYPLHIICGVLASLPIIFDFLPMLSWIAFAPVVYMALKREDSDQKRYRRAYLRGLCYFYAYGLGVFYWFVELYPLDFTGMTKASAVVVVVVAWFGLPLLQAIFSAFMFIVWEFLMHRLGLKRYIALVPITISALYVTFEWMQTLTWAGVPWAKLALTQTSLLPVLQSVSLFGPYFTTFLIILVNSLLALSAYYIINKASKISISKASVISFSLALLIFASNFIYGALYIYNAGYKLEENRVTAAAIQANISSKDKGNESLQGSVFDKYTELTLNAADDGAELIIWPETAMPYVLNANTLSGFRNILSDLAKESGATLIIGGFEKTEGIDNLKNSLYHITDDGVFTEDTYVKRRLVPFGEFVPMRPLIMLLIPPLSELSMLQSDLIAGDSSAIIETEQGKIGGLICYDSIFESLTRESVKDGAELIADSTNDSWFSDSAAVYEHNRHSVLRAIENCRYVVRAANTGISSIITPNGEFLDDLEPLVDGYVIADVYRINDLTLYTKTGNIILLAMWAWLVGSSVFTKLRSSKKHV